MKQYLDLLEDIKLNGTRKPSGREGMPDVIGITSATMKIDLRQGFPLLTTKRMYFKGIVHELLWYMRGDTNIAFLVQNDCHFWNKNAYRHYERLFDTFVGTIAPKLTIEEFVSKIAHNELYYPVIPKYKLGDLGPVYGEQWRNRDGVDQLHEIYNALLKNPYERYKIIDLWSPAQRPQMALPPCLLLYQFLVSPKESGEGNYLDLNMYQRSADVFLGVPFDIASQALFLEIMAKATGMTARYIFWIGGHCDIYTAHVPAVEEQLTREPKPLPSLHIPFAIKNFYELTSLKYTDFELVDYHPDNSIKAELFA